MIGRRSEQKKGEKTQGSSSWDAEIEHREGHANRSVNEPYTSERSYDSFISFHTFSLVRDPYCKA